MKITRKIDTTNAKYSIDDLNEEQFCFLLGSLSHYAMYTHHCVPDKTSPIGDLIDKLVKMKESSVTIIN
jgi:hypothetical protein